MWCGRRAVDDFHSITFIGENEEFAILKLKSVKRIFSEVSRKDAVGEDLFGVLSDHKFLVFECTQIQSLFY